MTFIAVRYLADYRGAEFPPSPLKLLQAVIASSQDTYFDVLSVLEAQTPVIHAAPPVSEYRYERYVINNDERLEHNNTGTKKIDVVREFDDATTHVVYEYDIPDTLLPRLREAVSRVHTLGRAGDWVLASVTDRLPAGLDTYKPVAGGQTVLRCPLAGSVNSLFAHYSFTKVPVVFKDVAYAKNPSRALPRVLFMLTEPVPVHQVAEITENIRRATMAAGIANAHGHDFDAPRLLISPLATTDWGDNMVRRVVISSTDSALVAQAATKLAGVPVGSGYLIPAEQDAVFAQYTGASKRWKSVTPVLQSGYHNGDAKKRAKVYARMFEHAGLPVPVAVHEVSADTRDFKVSSKHGHDKLPRIHLLLEFAGPVSGIVAVGTGRFSGLGLFQSV